MVRKPVSDARRLLPAVIVNDQMDVHIVGYRYLHRAQEFQKFAATMAPVQFANDDADGDIELREQGRRAMPFVIMCA